MPDHTLLFDLDGTLTNPRAGFLASLHFALGELGEEIPPEEELIRFIGPPLRQTMGVLLENPDTGRIEEGVTLYRQHLDAGSKFEAEVIEGIPEVLEHFCQRGFDLFVCTGKPECVAGEIIDHFDLGQFFKTVYGAKLDGLHADKADLIEHIWVSEGIDSPEGVMIGDTVFDIRAGKTHGLSSIGVAWGFGETEDLVEAGSDRMVDHPSELIEAIESVL